MGKPKAKKRARRTRKREMYEPPVMDPPVDGEIVTLDCSGEDIRRMYGLPTLDEEPES